MQRPTVLVLEPAIERKVQQVARFPGDVLITGPTGSGKSEVAAWIHANSAEEKGPFVPHNCATFPKELADRELFGHVRGAFTNADQDSPGLVAEAEGGTLFLDEIGELSLAVQAKLLTLLQRRMYRPVGAVKERPAKFRLIAATNRDLIEMCNQGLFREDLYHRINQSSLELPALRDTPERALEIAAAEIARMPFPDARREEALAAVGRLSRHPAAWRGNVRELLDFLKRCCFFEVEEQERAILDTWARWRRPDAAGTLTPFAPVRSPCIADRERYAGLLKQVARPGARTKALGSRQVALAFASRLLDARPAPVPMDEVREILGLGDRRSVEGNLAPLEEQGLVEVTGDGVAAVWPPASSMLFALRGDEWIPAGGGTILALSHGDRVRIDLTSRCTGVLRALIVTHGPSGTAAPAILDPGRELRPMKPEHLPIRFDQRGGLEQILLHVGPSGTRGGQLVEPLMAEGIMPDSEALERARRSVLEQWGEGWVCEHLVFHAQRA